MTVKSRIYSQEKQRTNINVFDVLVNPVVTEKATIMTQFGQYTFNVRPDATKADVKVAVETSFKVNVESVSTLIKKGKNKRFRGRLGRRSDEKKAIVTLKKGQSIDIAAGLK